MAILEVVAVVFAVILVGIILYALCDAGAKADEESDRWSIEHPEVKDHPAAARGGGRRPGGPS